MNNEVGWSRVVSFSRMEDSTGPAGLEDRSETVLAVAIELENCRRR